MMAQTVTGFASFLAHGLSARINKRCIAVQQRAGSSFASNNAVLRHDNIGRHADRVRVCGQSGASDTPETVLDTVLADGSTPISSGEDLPSRPPDETPTERRLRESQGVLDRVQYIHNTEDWRRETEKAGEQLVVLEVESHEVCETGIGEEAELNWKDDKEKALEPCREIKHVFARTARDSPDVHFLALEADDPEAASLLDELGIEVLPTVQFYKMGKKLWEHRGIVALQQELGTGVLYYGDQAADGVRASSFVTEVATQSDIDDFVGSQPNDVLTVLDVSLQSATPCIRIFPAVMALAKNMKGYASFARFMGDASDESQEIMERFNVVEVPTFLFFRSGEEVGRFVGSSRGDLIGQILLMQNALGISPPPVQRPPKKVRQPKAKKSPQSAWL